MHMCYYIYSYLIVKDILFVIFSKNLFYCCNKKWKILLFNINLSFKYSTIIIYEKDHTKIIVIIKEGYFLQVGDKVNGLRDEEMIRVDTWKKNLSIQKTDNNLLLICIRNVECRLNTNQRFNLSLLIDAN